MDSHRDLYQATISQFIGSVEDEKIYQVGEYQLGRYQRKDSCGYSYEARKFRSAKSQHLGQVVILKKIQYGEDTAVEQLIYNNEINILSHLHNSNTTIKLLAHWKTNNRYFLVLQRNPLGNLAEFVDYVKLKGLALSEQQILFFLKQILHAVSLLHQQKILHRNLKLESIALGDQLNIKIADFSLATVGRNSLFAQSFNLGTPNYMPPQVLIKEQSLQHQWSQKAQIWSIGVIIYYLINWTYPLNIKNLNKQGLKISFNFPKRLKYQQLIILLQKMLQIDASKRPTIKQLLQQKIFSQDQSIQSTLLKKYNIYFQQKTKQKSTWKHKIDSCKLLIPQCILNLIQRPQKVKIIKMIKDRRFGYFMLLSNLKLIAYFNNQNIITFQANVVPTTNEEKILRWIYRQHFADLIKQKISEQSNIIYQEVQCNLKKIIQIKGSVLLRLTNQIIQVFFAKKEVRKGNNNNLQQYSTILCINHNRKFPNMIKLQKDKSQVLYKNLNKGIQQKNRYCIYVRDVFQAIIENSLAKLENEQNE